jgi:Septum formation initiator.
MGERAVLGSNPTGQTRGGQARGLTLLQALFWVITIAISIFLFYGIFSSSTGMKGYLNKKSQLGSIKQNIEGLEKENKRLYKTIKQFRDNPETRKEMIRRQLGWIQEGERKIIFVPQQ